MDLICGLLMLDLDLGVTSLSLSLFTFHSGILQRSIKEFLCLSLFCSNFLFFFVESTSLSINVIIQFLQLHFELGFCLVLLSSLEKSLLKIILIFLFQEFSFITMLHDNCTHSLQFCLFAILNQLLLDLFLL